MNGKIRELRHDLRNWLMEGQRDPAEVQDRIEALVSKYAPAPGDNDGMTFNEAVKGVCQTMTEFDLWDESLTYRDLELGDSIMDTVRRFLRDVLDDQLSDESAEFQGDCDDGTLFWCERGQHWVESDSAEAVACDDCGTEDCGDHGEVEERYGLTDENDDPIYPELCNSCYGKAQDAQDARDEIEHN